MSIELTEKQILGTHKHEKMLTTFIVKEIPARSSEWKNPKA